MWKCCQFQCCQWPMVRAWKPATPMRAGKRWSVRARRPWKAPLAARAACARSADSRSTSRFPQGRQRRPLLHAAQDTALVRARGGVAGPPRHLVASVRVSRRRAIPRHAQRLGEERGPRRAARRAMRPRRVCAAQPRAARAAHLHGVEGMLRAAQDLHRPHLPEVRRGDGIVDQR